MYSSFEVWNAALAEEITSPHPLSVAFCLPPPSFQAFSSASSPVCSGSIAGRASGFIQSGWVENTGGVAMLAVAQTSAVAATPTSTSAGRSRREAAAKRLKTDTPCPRERIITVRSTLRPGT